MRVLIVEDSADVAATIADYLEHRGHHVDCAYDGLTGLHLAASHPFDVLVLDLTLPGLDGVEVCRRLRQDAGNDIPILMLTARSEVNDKLDGLGSGADDYLVKPCDLKELEARLAALHRRHAGRVTTGPLRVGDLELREDTVEVVRAGVPIRLPRLHFQLLAMLMKASPRVVPRQDLEYALWGDDPPASDALRSHMHGLRQAIDKPFDQPLLETVHGVGYRLRIRHDETAA